MSVNSGLKTTKIICQVKAFHRQRMFSHARKETVDIDILVTSMKGNGQIMQSIKQQVNLHGEKKKWNQSSQF